MRVLGLHFLPFKLFQGDGCVGESVQWEEKLEGVSSEVSQ